MSKPPCRFPECIRQSHTIDGFCRSHRRQIVAGRPLTPLKEGPLDTRFWRSIDKNGPPSYDGSRCWVWTGSVNASGYGRIGFNDGEANRRELAHRVSYAMHHGAIPDGLSVLHACDNSRCVNPAHLRTGTQSENIAEARERGRMASGNDHGLRKHPERSAKGSDHGRSKLTEDQVLEIRRIGSDVSVRVADIASQFHISTTTVYQILLRRKWKHI